jgi:hypothetical protein
MSSILSPPFDHELGQIMKTFPDTGEITHDFIIQDRKETNAQFTSEIVTSDPEISPEILAFQDQAVTTSSSLSSNSRTRQAKAALEHITSMVGGSSWEIGLCLSTPRFLSSESSIWLSSL